MSSHYRTKRYLSAILAAGLIVTGLACGRQDATEKVQASETKKSIAVTLPVIAMIVRELAPDDVEVVSLLPAGASPHTYDPRPEDIALVEGTLLFAADPGIDGWAADLPAGTTVFLSSMLADTFKIRPAFDFEEEHSDDNHEGHGKSEDKHADHGGWDPHFWTDPLAVANILPALGEHLCGELPASCTDILTKQKAFDETLQKLHEETKHTLAEAAGKPVMLFHLSFQHLLDRYSIPIAGVITPFPGKEPTPKEIIKLIETIKAKHVEAIFTEPQLPRAPVDVIAENSNFTVYSLDPIGHPDSRYAEWFRKNTATLAEALKE